MGELADAVQEGGGHVTGIIPQQLIQKGRPTGHSRT